jgi:hypothetical protein
VGCDDPTFPDGRLSPAPCGAFFGPPMVVAHLSLKRLVIERGAVEDVDHLVPGPPLSPRSPQAWGSTNPALGALRGGVFVWVENTWSSLAIVP